MRDPRNLTLWSDWKGKDELQFALMGKDIKVILRKANGQQVWRLTESQRRSLAEFLLQEPEEDDDGPY